MKLKFIILVFVGLIGCIDSTQNEFKTIDTGRFVIEVPANWNYKKEKGIDSFVGSIVGRKIKLSFDLSRFGYANHLIPTETEFVFEKKSQWMPITPYHKEGVYYTSGDVKGERKRLMAEKGIKDTSLIKVEPFQTPRIKILKENDKYLATLTYKDTIVNMSIEIPDEIKNYLFQVDTIGNYKRKIVRPKSGNEGMVGVYYDDINSGFNFNMYGRNINMENQEKVIKAFKSIKFNRD